MFNCSASLAMSTSVLKTLPGKLDIKRHSPSILYKTTSYLFFSQMIAKIDWTPRTTPQYKVSAQKHTHWGQRQTMHKQHRGSYMSAHVLLNLLNELGKRDKMRGLPSILSLFRKELNEFNNTRARMLDSIYHMTLRYL